MEVVLAKGTAVLSKIIQYATKSEWTHSACKYSEPESKWMVHSSVFGVMPEWTEYFFKHYKKTKMFKAKFSVADHALDEIVKETEHQPYDYLGLAGFGLVILLGLIGIRIKNPLGSKKRLFCSELLTAWLTKCKEIDQSLNLPDFDSELTSPQMLDAFMSSRPDLFEIV